jgi:hypothetical protein
VQVEDVGVLFPHGAGEREDALVAGKESDAYAESLQCFRKQPLVWDAFAPVGRKDYLH